MVLIKSVCRPPFFGFRRLWSVAASVFRFVRIVRLHLLLFFQAPRFPIVISGMLMRMFFLPFVLSLIVSAVPAAPVCPADTVSPDILPSESRSMTAVSAVSDIDAVFPRFVSPVSVANFSPVVSFSSATGADTIAAAVSERLTELLRNDIFARTQVGLYVYDLTADRPVFACGERQQLRPASNQKLVTSIAALTLLGTDYLYRTSLGIDGTVSDSVLHGSLCVRAGFDPLFDRDDLRAFVSAVEECGICSVDGDLLFDRSIKDTVSLGWGWCWDDDEVPLSPLLYDGRPGLENRLAEAFAERGIILRGRIRYGLLPATAETVCERTHTIDQVLLPMMKRSDNLFAESLFYQIAARSGRRYAGRKQATSYVNGLIAGLGLHPSAYQIADGSGLSLYNYLSPELLVALLRHAYRHSAVYSHLLPSLPVAGIDGTLRRRMKSGPACGNVCAKTGTVEGVSTLSGYCTAPDGHTYCFSIMNQGIRHTSTGRNFQDRVCQALTRPLEAPDAVSDNAESASDTMSGDAVPVTEEIQPTAADATE